MPMTTLTQPNLPTVGSGTPRWKKFKGTEKAAVVFLCLGEKRGAELMKKLSSEEIQQITAAMSGLGSISAEEIEAVILEFAELFAKDSGLTGSLSIAENMLREFLPEDQIQEVLDKVRGPIKERDLWARFNSQSETVIAEYLMNEHEQTAAAIISKLNPSIAAKVIPLLAPDVMQDVIERMINMETVPSFIMEQIEETLQNDIIDNTSQSKETEMQEHMANIFNHLQPKLFEEIATGLKKNLSETFEGIKNKMFTFDDMINLSAQDLAKITRGVQGNTLPLALRGASKELRDHFLNSLPSRSRDMLLDEMNSMGAVRGRDAREAQMLIVEQTKILVEEGTVVLPSDGEEDDDDILE
ncbi:MAG: flagellar motor protein [Rhodobacteraceae bacterium]|nr:MAG: flagellar motor protein [Paracoccaceae bacterium]